MPLTPSPPPTIELSDFTMRVWSIADAPALRRALDASDAHLRAWTPWVVDGRVPGMSLEERLAEHAARFAAGTEWVYGLFARDGHEVLGGCGLYPRIGPRAVELGYWLAASHTGRGFATRSAAALTRVAFLDSSIDRVEIRCNPGNVASARVPQRLGYRVADSGAAATSANLVTWQLARKEHADT